jgi:hypothetical protein
MDLTKFTTWSSETINLGDTLRIYDSMLDLNIKVRVMKITKDYSAENIYIELANKFDRATKTLADLLSSLSNITFTNDYRAMDIRDVTFGDTYSAVGVPSGLPMAYVIVLSGKIKVGDYQGPVIPVYRNATVTKLWAYIAQPVYTGAVSDIIIDFHRTGSSIGTVTIPAGSQVGTTAINVPLAIGDLLNIGILMTDGVSSILTTEYECG